jgi:hypothetical protein
MAKKVFEKFIEIKKKATEKQEVQIEGETRAN